MLLCGEEQLSLATPSCIISGTGDLFIDHSWEIQLYIICMDAAERESTEEKWNCSYGALAAEEQLSPLKAAPVIAVSQKSAFT